MTTSVVTVDRITPYQEIDRLLAEHQISGMPVLKMGREVAGVVSEADLLAAEDETSRKARMASSTAALAAASAAARGPDRRDADDHAGHHHRPRRDHPGRGAADEHAPRQEAAGGRRGRQAGRHRQPPRPAERLPAPGHDIIRDVWQILDEIPLGDPRQVIVTVHHGVVTLAGTMRPEPGDSQDLIPLALRLIWDIDGVVDVVNRLTDSREATSRRPALPVFRRGQERAANRHGPRDRIRGHRDVADLEYKASNGFTTPRKARKGTRPPGGRSWTTTRSRPSWAGSATGRARPPGSRGDHQGRGRRARRSVRRRMPCGAIAMEPEQA